MDDRAIIKEIRNNIKKGDSNKAIELLKSNEHLLEVMTPFGTWLHIASKRGDMEVIKYLVSKGIDVNVCGGTFEANALKTAAGAGQLEVVKYLLDNGSDMDISFAKKNPLFGAIYGGHFDVVQELIKRGIDITVRYTSDSLTDMDAYGYAREFGQTEIADYLKQLLNK
ncbi:ankyrin repeat domain-containing protein [Clostridium felsineum]|uniref:ankyrin repeat domain-containing protein n=1 Tax=Clostridium felsineum TaxID=36839 RepID=UPI00214DBB11|nr:ankyrin repeat domain-containing protein [Clostridium felsineum]MCR3761913.1 ankyrin repeat domain-containing protein [Clostridium felsineum]